MLIDRVHVEEVVLHLPYDAPERRQVSPENPVLIHAPQLVHDAAGCCSSDRKVARLRDRAVRGVDALARAPQGAQRLGRHALELRVLLHDQEALQDRPGVSLEEIGAARVEQLADAREFFVDRFGVGIPDGKDLGADVLQHDGVELGDGLGRAEVRLASAALRRGGARWPSSPCRAPGFPGSRNSRRSSRRPAA